MAQVHRTQLRVLAHEISALLSGVAVILAKLKLQYLPSPSRGFSRPSRVLRRLLRASSPSLSLPPLRLRLPPPLSPLFLSGCSNRQSRFVQLRAQHTPLVVRLGLS